MYTALKQGDWIVILVCVHFMVLSHGPFEGTSQHNVFLLLLLLC